VVKKIFERQGVAVAQLSPEESFGLEGTGQNLPLGGDDQDTITLGQILKIVGYLDHLEASARIGLLDPLPGVGRESTFYLL
jgi:hypothetical protein